MSNEWEDIVNQPFPRFPLEESVVGRDWLLEQETVPETELQSLMEAAPGAHPKLSKQNMGDLAALAGSLDSILDRLTDEERAVVETTIIAGHSVRHAAAILGWHKSTVHRLKQSAIVQMRRFILEGLNDDTRE